MLEGKNIVVTGANRGIGKAIVEEIAKNHGNVWACMRSCDDGVRAWMADTEKKNGVRIKEISIDLLDEESIKEAASDIIKDKISIDGVVNNAGVVGDNQLFSMTKPDGIRDTFQVNFFGPMFFLQRLLKRMMREKKGSVVSISSIASLDGEPGQFAYVSSKAAINGATKKLASELGPFGIRVNAVAPGMTETDMISEMKVELRDKTLDRVSLNRPGEPQEIAKLVVYLLSESSSYISGQIIRVDGGSL